MPSRPSATRTKSHVLQMLEFVHDLRSDFFEAAATLGWKEFTRDRGVSLGSYRNLFLHLASVEEQHVTKFCEGVAAPWPSWRAETSSTRYRSIEAVRQRLREVTAMAERRFARWDSPREMARRVVWVRLGHPIRLSRESALTQCTTEHLLHLGEIEAMLWQRDLEPPTTLWIDRHVLQGRPPAPPPVPILRNVVREQQRRPRPSGPKPRRGRSRRRARGSLRASRRA